MVGCRILFSYLRSPVGTPYTAWTSICTLGKASRATIAPATRRSTRCRRRWCHFGLLALVLYINVHVDTCGMADLFKQIYIFTLLKHVIHTRTPCVNIWLYNMVSSKVPTKGAEQGSHTLSNVLQVLHIGLSR